MAASGLNEKRYSKLFRKLLPQGWAWDRKGDTDSTLYQLSSSLSLEFCRVEDRSQELLNEADPQTTLEMLSDWEALLGLPDECSPTDENLSIQERRNRVIQVLTTRGGQNEEFYRNLASNFGYDIDVITVSDQPPFRAGEARAGDRLTNGSWRYAFIIAAPADSVVRFRAGQSQAGDPLLSVQNDVLECLIEKHKPAHAVAIFSFGNF